MHLCRFASLVLLTGLFSSSSSSTASNSYLQNLKRPRRHNVPGNLFVDESCIDCDACRWMCPSVYSRVGIKAAVTRQPSTDDEKIAAYLAMVTCPSGSIRLKEPDRLVKEAIDMFPLEIQPQRIPGVMHLGYHSSESYGATSYLVTRGTKGNVMIDVPRFNTRLADQIEELGELKYIILTHRDDVHGHDRWKGRFPNVKRIMHRLDSSKTQKTNECEVLLEGTGSWEQSDIQLIHTPGHTPGSICVLINTGVESVLFTGDTLGYSGSKKRLDGFKQYNWGSIDAQYQSLLDLATDEFPYTWILPGHGRMANFVSLDEKNTMVSKAAVDFKDGTDDDAILAVGYY